MAEILSVKAPTPILAQTVVSCPACSARLRVDNSDVKYAEHCRSILIERKTSWFSAKNIVRAGYLYLIKCPACHGNFMVRSNLYGPSRYETDTEPGNGEDFARFYPVSVGTESGF